MPKAYGTVPTIEAGEEIELSATGDVIPQVQAKQGHTCCGVCCDVRRASIIVNILKMSSIVMYLVVGLMVNSAEVDEAMDDDEAKVVLSSLYSPTIMIISCLNLILLGIATYGAIKFSANLVLVGLVMHTVGAVTSLIPFDLYNVAINGLYAYPNFFLYQEIKKGIMSPSNYYQNEQESCCCV